MLRLLQTKKDAYGGISQVCSIIRAFQISKKSYGSIYFISQIQIYVLTFRPYLMAPDVLLGGFMEFRFASPSNSQCYIIHYNLHSE
jgi:hypothetical protein